MEARIDSPADRLEAVAEGLYRDGWHVDPGFLNPELAAALLEEVMAHDRAARLERAGIGRGTDHTLAENIRGDRTRWLDGSSPAQLALLDRMEALRLTINRHLMLGLFDYEAHFALYPAGSFYKRHLDSFHGARDRIVTTVLYLTPDWRPEDEGYLRIYAPQSDERLAEVRPEAGTLACFLSEEIPHEVLPTRRERTSIAGWFRRNTSQGQAPDPAR